jgi:acetyltransferase-like isoleucine patch superfamily enzyme
MMNARHIFNRLVVGLARWIIPPEWTSSLFMWELKNSILRLTGMKIGYGAGFAAGFTSVPGRENNLEVGAYSGLAYGARVINLAPVKIGAYTTLAADVTLATGGPGVPPSETNRGRGMNIGRGCWIGNGAYLVGEISVGDHAVIGAGAMVLENIPACAIAVGVPARVIRYRTLPEKVWLGPNLLLDSKTFELIPETTAP